VGRERRQPAGQRALGARRDPDSAAAGGRIAAGRDRRRGSPVASAGGPRRPRARGVGRARAGRLRCTRRDARRRLRVGGATRRRDGLIDVPATTRIRVVAGSDRVEFTTSIDNAADDHRLRVRFAAPDASYDSTIRAEGHFGVVRRTARPVWTGAAWYEPPAL